MPEESPPPPTDGPGVGCGLMMILAFLSVAIVGFQAFLWLKTGEWFELPLWKTLEFFGGVWRPPVEIEGWGGVAKILSSLLETPTALCPVIAAVLILFLLPNK